jgi:hypothetical protein
MNPSSLIRTVFLLSARSEGITSLECYSSINAEIFYSALGFTSVRCIDVQLGSQIMFPGVLMRRSI